MVEPISSILFGWGVSKAADVLFEQAGGKLQARLNRSELEGAIAQGLQSAIKAEDSLAPSEKLFFHCDDRKQSQFKSAAFSNSDVLGELQRPFHDAGKPRLEYLIAAFRQIAQETDAPLNEQGLKRWLEEFAEAYFQKTSEICFQVALEDYCEQLINQYDDIKFLGIDDIDPNEESKQLETVFVMPDAVSEVRQNLQNYQAFDLREGRVDFSSARDVSPEEFARSTSLSDLMNQASDASDKRQQNLLAEQRRLSRESAERWSGERISARKLLEQTESNKLVLLGAPGSGKTTLMSYFAMTLAKDFCKAYTQQPSSLSEHENTESAALADQESGLVLPILIRIRDLAFNSNLSILDYLRQFAEGTLSCEKLPGEFFETFLRDGKALILLDGLDEVADEGRRQDIVQKIDNFLGQYGQNRAIVTSRPAGYRRDFFRTSEYGHYQLQPFTDEQIQQFITQWYDSRAQTPAEAERDRDSLWKALNEQARIKLLARNPLLLTIIALIHRYRADLPRDRFELYDRAVNTLIRTWDRKREITSHQVLQYLRLDDLRRLMEQLAYWIHSQGGVGDSEGGTLIDKEELLQQLGQFIREMKRVERHEAKAEAERFLQHIQERTGLLNEQGQDRYAFVHKTFQEYLTAQEIRDH